MLPRSSLPPLQRAATEAASALSRMWALTQLGQEAEQQWGVEVRLPLWTGTRLFCFGLPVTASFGH